MAEFKMNKLISTQITALSTGGQNLNANYSATDAADVKSLSAAAEFIKEQTRIKNLIDLYASLLAKDAADLNAMVATVDAADQSASTTYKA